MASRRVILICGAPGSGKTTLAHTTGLTVYDLDDPQWHGSERLFRDALRKLAQDPQAQAAVIRCAATPSARARAASMCSATEVVVLDTDLQTCIERIVQRSRGDVRTQIAAAQGWWKSHEADPHTPTTITRPLTTSRAW